MEFPPFPRSYQDVALAISTHSRQTDEDLELCRCTDRRSLLGGCRDGAGPPLEEAQVEAACFAECLALLSLRVQPLVTAKPREGEIVGDLSGVTGRLRAAASTSTPRVVEGSRRMDYLRPAREGWELRSNLDRIRTLPRNRIRSGQRFDLTFVPGAGGEQASGRRGLIGRARAVEGAQRRFTRVPGAFRVFYGL